LKEWLDISWVENKLRNGRNKGKEEGRAMHMQKVVCKHTERVALRFKQIVASSRATESPAGAMDMLSWKMCCESSLV
jgi:hypothetical protein